MILYKSCHIQRQTDINCQIIPEMIIIAIFQTDRQNIYRFFRTKLFIRTQSDTENAFAQRQQRMHRTMRTFRKNAERNTIMQSLYRFIHRLVIMPHFIHAITHSTDRHDLEPCQQFGLLGLAEDICASDKHLARTVYTKDRHRVTERVRMIRSKNNCAIGRDILLAYILNMTIRTPEHPVHVRTKKCVQSVLVLYRRHT